MATVAKNAAEKVIKNYDKNISIEENIKKSYLNNTITQREYYYLFDELKEYNKINNEADDTKFLQDFIDSHATQNQ